MRMMPSDGGKNAEAGMRGLVNRMFAAVLGEGFYHKKCV